MSRIIHLSGKTNDSADCSTVFLMKLGWTLYKKSFIFCFIFSLEAAGMAPLRRISIHQNQGLLLNLKKQVVTMGNIQKKMERLQQRLQYQASDSAIVIILSKKNLEFNFLCLCCTNVMSWSARPDFPYSQTRLVPGVAV